MNQTSTNNSGESPLAPLLEKARRGDRDARNELFEKCRAYVSLVARAQVGSWLQAKVDHSDLVQQTLLEAHRGLDQFRGTTDGEWLAWLKRIVHHNAADFVRRYGMAERRRAGREVSLNAPRNDDSNGPTRDPSDPGQTPSQIVLRSEEQMAVSRAVAQLPPDYQEVIILRNLERLPFDQIAERLGRSRPAVQMLWMRAVQAARKPGSMTAREPISDPAPDEVLPPEEAELFAILDRYLSSLHGGDLPSRTSLIERHPALAKWAKYLELLDCLAPEGAPSERASSDQPPRAADAAPQPFGKYELLGEIGRGGMGVVYRAIQTDLDRPVALKMILSSRLASPDDVNRFYAEARAAGKLRHANIVGIHEAGEVHGQHFFAMDFIEGRSLAQELAHGPFDPQRAAECVAAVGRAVEYLHAHNMIHRDLKPSNILLSADGTPYVTDFGLVKAFDTSAVHTQTGLIVGTIGYMSPEQAAGHAPAHSPQSDIYSLGAILFELLTGRPPFQNASPIDTLLEVIEGEPPRPRQLNRNIPQALELVCLRCLEKDPRRRYPSAAALVDDLERFLRGEPLNVTPAGYLHRALRWARREPTLAMHLGAILVSVLIVQIKYMISGYDWPYHLTVMILFGGWAAVSLLCQALLRRAGDKNFARYLWAAADAYLLTVMLYVADNPLGPLLVGYPLLIVASGLFFRVRLVTFMTIACLTAYGSLVLVGRDPIVKSQYTLIYAAALIVIGFVCGYQTYRVRVLSSYFEGRGSRR